ncbi:hypothetical protein NEOLEDRAFT_1139946 [Neolentinus lepideus HHB14362 ss-1]|uniref:Uncharacterized protein n=1 Tax=Neolentinus lepideus HHB14362 ss-1 TaxID=1314782 RepID=A0A165PIN4_9AGAM|nr:hypothetical protein NEOLEDRAFT_1139946 [Neolentinus lepideus HHB14362 ss-1]
MLSSALKATCLAIQDMSSITRRAPLAIQETPASGKRQSVLRLGLGLTELNGSYCHLLRVF